MLRERSELDEPHPDKNLRQPVGNLLKVGVRLGSAGYRVFFVPMGVGEASRNAEKEAEQATGQKRASRDQQCDGKDVRVAHA